MSMTPNEEYAFYQSGLVASGCLENIDEYMNGAIVRYGRLLTERTKNADAEIERLRQELDDLRHQNSAQAAMIEQLKKKITL